MNHHRRIYMACMCVTDILQISLSVQIQIQREVTLREEDERSDGMN